MDKEQRAISIIETSNLLETLASQDQMIDLQRYDEPEYKRQMIEIAPDFAERFPTIFQLVLDRKDLTTVHIILQGHIDHSRGKISTDKLDEQLGKSLANKMYEFK
jgi:hypothetical protein